MGRKTYIGGRGIKKKMKSVLMSVEGRKRSNKANMMKKKNKPIKVVYISNPLKVSTSASQFRALVQELTGQDAPEFPPRHPTEYSNNNIILEDDDKYSHIIVPEAEEVRPKEEIWEEQVGRSMEWFEPLDEVDHVFTAQMMDSFSAILPPGAFYESAPQLDQMLRTTTPTLHAL
ncbi:Sigma factor binding protein 2, chloroplastic [Senna tora]|uniref:Sigma factor binding protein 2, chloroplastic n=1 Tax=Senna tora TaxID=362788 RepID=A0A834TDD6_9FABA|nr:Sigma factor binding protein 2, chloroplastic [Senna tora]